MRSVPVVLLLFFTGCSDETKGECAGPRADGEACNAPPDKVCSYLDTAKCPCPVTTPEPVTCTCVAGKWSCKRSDVCMPCFMKDRGIDVATTPREASVGDHRTEGSKLDGLKKGCVPPCSANQVCIQLFDGNCKTGAPGCKPVSAGCLTAGCTAACEKELCPSPYQCQTQVPCGTEQGAQINCYGP